MRHKTKQNIKKAGIVLAVLAIGIFAGAALTGDADTSSSPENRTFLQDVQESIVGATSAVTSTYEPYTVEVIDVTDDQLYKEEYYTNRKYDKLSGTDIHISIRNNAEEILNTEIINVGIVYNDGTQQEALEYYKSDFIGVSYSRLPEYIDLYPSAKGEYHFAFGKIDRDKSPKLTIRFLKGRFTSNPQLDTKVISLSPHI